ncbi:MAG: orotidine-5'-phosphate decarboxylase [Dehalogenimonas sp.]|uniref:Orotidine 5'-phosphate decarboxylase n=1 Tax=Candidatus Dehalogenimonas loeffleri TaxID=3127115 RepID=A0ABZ2J5V6_9CHLR|nr:orotidine-5'-phosphate decarboxylase [Dehalogenimonas sp.]
MNFIEKLTGAARANDSWLCVGLDPELGRLPSGTSTFEFCRAVIEATQDLACAFKPNAAFFEALGSDGWTILKTVIDAVPKHIPVILDAKRGDIGNTAVAYARSAFEHLGADAVTVNPYMGYDSVKPFTDYPDRGVFVLCRTSNPGSADFQSLEFDGKPLYQIVADKVVNWNTFGNLGLVVGATKPDELRTVRVAHPELPLLIPGVGAQGGSLELAVKNGVNATGELAIINSSRQIIYASYGVDFAAAARQAALNLRDQINWYRRK